MKTVILIPARLASTRFPEKMLQPLFDKPLIRHVYDECKKSGYDTFVLTDSKKIASIIPDAILTGKAENGTERCAWYINNVVESKQYDYFINVQGDMPDIDLEIIDNCKRNLEHYSVTTVWTEMPKEKQNDPNSVKMIRAGNQALWFGRGMTGYGEWHLGVYGYRRKALEMYLNLDVTLEEKIEQLEQLRWLKNGWQIGCKSVYFNGIEINEPEDVDKWHSKNFH